MPASQLTPSETQRAPAMPRGPSAASGASIVQRRGSLRGMDYATQRKALSPEQPGAAAPSGASVPHLDAIQAAFAGREAPVQKKAEKGRAQPPDDQHQGAHHGPAAPKHQKNFDDCNAEEQLELILKAYEIATRSYQAAFPSKALEIFGPGWAVNAGETLKGITAFGKWERGCEESARNTEKAIMGIINGHHAATSKWTYTKLQVGAGPLQHHAVALFKKGTSENEGYVLDPWKAGNLRMGGARASMFTYPDWLAKNWYLSDLIAKPIDQESGAKIKRTATTRPPEG